MTVFFKERVDGNDNATTNLRLANVLFSSNARAINSAPASSIPRYCSVLKGERKRSAKNHCGAGTKSSRQMSGGRNLSVPSELEAYLTSVAPLLMACRTRWSSSSDRVGSEMECILRKFEETNCTRFEQ